MSLKFGYWLGFIIVKKRKVRLLQVHHRFAMVIGHINLD